MSQFQSVRFKAIAATTAAFTLYGGVYVMDANATWGGGSVTLERLGADDTTYIAVATALSADGTSGAIALPPGTYKFVVVSATALYVSVTRIPSA